MQKRTAAPNFDIMKLLLSHGADPNQKILDLRPGDKFISLLHIVAKSTCLKRYSLITMVIIELLLGNDADINAPDSNGRTPLFYAYKWGNVKLGNFLRDNGDFHGDEFRRGFKRLSGSGRSHQIQEFLQIRRPHRRYLATKIPKRS
jgi:ankyrin repeat protein